MSKVAQSRVLKLDERLALLDIKEQDLLTAIKAGFIAMASCTDNDATIIPGMVRWQYTVRTLREILLPQGWEKLDSKNSPLTVNSRLNIAIMIATGDANTGIPYSEPRTKARKGKNTKLAIRNNAQLEMFPETLPQINDSSFRRQTWVLLSRVAGSEIRAELSLPLEMDETGHIAGWSERIILPSIPIESIEPYSPEPVTFAPNPEVEITRRHTLIIEE